MKRTSQDRISPSKSERKSAPGSRAASKKSTPGPRGRKATGSTTRPRRHLASKATADTLLADLPLPGSMRKQVASVLQSLERKHARKPKKVL